jgi:putative redox protein
MNTEDEVSGSIGTQNYLCQIKWRNGNFVMDEPISYGGEDLGPDPYSTLLSALAGCTLSTLRMYINRKEWNIAEINVKLNLRTSNENGFSTEFYREITFSNDVTEEQKQKLLIIANKCPVSKILENQITIKTNI